MSEKKKYKLVDGPHLQRFKNKLDSLYNSIFVKKTDYASTNAYGVVKPDGSTITASSGILTAVAQSMDIEDINDVVITSITDGQILKYDSATSKWVNANETGGGTTVSWTEIQQSGTKIAEISINGTTTDVYAPTGGGSSTLAGLSDVSVTNPSDGDLLRYNATTSKWEKYSPPFYISGDTTHGFAPTYPS